MFGGSSWNHTSGPCGSSPMKTPPTPAPFSSGESNEKSFRPPLAEMFIELDVVMSITLSWLISEQQRSARRHRERRALRVRWDCIEWRAHDAQLRTDLAGDICQRVHVESVDLAGRPAEHHA